MRDILLALVFSLISFPALAAAAYQLMDNTLAANAQAVVREADNASIPNDPHNKDYHAYLRWLNKGNKPDAASMHPPTIGTLHPKP
jgi:hypothetical protein